MIHFKFLVLFVEYGVSREVITDKSSKEYCQVQETDDGNLGYSLTVEREVDKYNVEESKDLAFIFIFFLSPSATPYASPSFSFKSKLWGLSAIA